MVVNAFHAKQLAASGVAFATILCLAPQHSNSAASIEVPQWHEHRGKFLCYLITAKDDVISIYEVRDPCAYKSPTQAPYGSQKPSLPSYSDDSTYFYHVKTHTLFGTVTGLETVRTIGSEEDGNDRVIVSFRDAKLALLEWDETVQDLMTVSIHTYERASQLAYGLRENFQPILSVDPAYRCSTLLLPGDALAILPFMSREDYAALDFIEAQASSSLPAVNNTPITQEKTDSQSLLPYMPSFVLPFSEIDPRIRNVRHTVFLPDFQKPTMAVLFEKELTWTGQLATKRDTCCVYFVTLDIAQSHYPLILTKEGLPYDSLYLVPCPQDIRGVLLVTPSALFQLDQNGNTVGMATNDWTHIVTSVPTSSTINKQKDVMDPSVKGPSSTNTVSSLVSESSDLPIDLQNSFFVFVTSTVGLLFLQEGMVLQVNFSLDGRSVAQINASSVGSSVCPSTALNLPNGTLPLTPSSQDTSLIFLGSMVGDSALLSISPMLPTGNNESGPTSDPLPTNRAPETGDMDLDDIDLYGETMSPTSNGINGSFSNRLQLQIGQISILHGLGPISDLSQRPSSFNNSGPLETLACTGARRSGGFTSFERCINSRKFKQILQGSSCGLWCFPVLRDDIEGDNELKEILFVSDFTCTRILSVNVKGSMHLLGTAPGRTLCAARLDGSDLFARCLEGGIFEVLSENGNIISTICLNDEANEDQSDARGETNFPIAALTGSFALWAKRNGSIKLAVFSENNKCFEQIRLPPDMRDGPCISGSFFHDKYNLLDNSRQDLKEPSFFGQEAAQANLAQNTSLDHNNVIDNPSPANLSGLASDTPARNGDSYYGDRADKAKKSNIYLTLTLLGGEVQIYNLPELTLLWRSEPIGSLPFYLRPRAAVEAASEFEYPDIPISSTVLTYIGDVPYLLVIFETNFLVVYEGHPCAKHLSTLHEQTLQPEKVSLGFVKVLAHQFLNAPKSPQESSSHFKSLYGSAIPFDDIMGASGAFLPGNDPSWLLKTQQGALFLHPSSMHNVVSFASSTMFSQFGLFYAHDESGTFSATFPRLSFEFSTPHRFVNVGRTCTHITCHMPTKVAVCASLVDQAFVLFDPEDGQMIADPSSDPTPAVSQRGLLELYSPDCDEPMHGYELEQNETVCSLKTLKLHTSTNSEGLKSYVVAGTIISNGEDRPARGAVYIFDIVEVVGYVDDTAPSFKLRLVCKDDAKGPITALTDMNGYLVTSVGQKLFVRSFENDEWLVNVAFLDVPFYITDIQRLKNFLLLSDIKRGLWFVVFQEEPYKLILIGKDYNDCHVTMGGFLVNNDSLGLISAGFDKVIRLHDFAPSIPTSQGGQKLLLRTEYQTSGEVSSSLMIPGKLSNSGPPSLQTELVFGMTNGAIETLLPVDETVYRRLQFLQGQLLRNIQHFAGLNPRGFRAVRNESTSRPLLKGILDGDLLSRFEMLPRPKMDELAAMLPDNHSANQILEDLASLRSQWGHI